MVYSIEKILSRYGSDLILHHGDDEIIFRGFLQHSGSRSWQNVEKTFGPLGSIPGGMYILLAPVSVELSEEDTIHCNSLAVTIRRLEIVTVGK